MFLLITDYFSWYAHLALVNLFRFSRVNGDAVDLNQKCFGVRIYSGAEWVMFCVFMQRKFRENKKKVANSASLCTIMVLSASFT